MTHYAENVVRNTNFIALSESPYRIAKYRGFSFGEKGRTEAFKELDTRSRGRGKLPSKHPEDESFVLIEIQSYVHNPDEVEKAKVARDQKKVENAQKKANRVPRAERTKRTPEEILLNAAGEKVRGNTKEYQILIKGEGPEPTQRMLLSIPADAEHSHYGIYNKKKDLDGVIAEGEKVWVSTSDSANSESVFASRKPAIFRGFVNVGNGAVPQYVAQVEVVLNNASPNRETGRKIELVPLKKSGIFVRRADAPALVFEKKVAQRKPRTKKTDAEAPAQAAPTTESPAEGVQENKAE